jgi:hypothetical protein
MMRAFVLLAATGFAAACMSSGPTTEPDPTAVPERSVAEPTDGIENETSVESES